ncbi:hypothetical protein B0H13DRAFT_1890672 [Mycena leptocephala]|nr:hypothetical protein B0H13DRAFT_1890672 [Mycena leptocephala]
MSATYHTVCPCFLHILSLCLITVRVDLLARNQGIRQASRSKITGHKGRAGSALVGRGVLVLEVGKAAREERFLVTLVAVIACVSVSSPSTGLPAPASTSRLSTSTPAPFDFDFDFSTLVTFDSASTAPPSPSFSLPLPRRTPQRAIFIQYYLMGRFPGFLRQLSVSSGAIRGPGRTKGPDELLGGVRKRQASSVTLDPILATGACPSMVTGLYFASLQSVPQFHVPIQGNTSRMANSHVTSKLYHHMDRLPMSKQPTMGIHTPSGIGIRHFGLLYYSGDGTFGKISLCPEGGILEKSSWALEGGSLEKSADHFKNAQLTRRGAHSANFLCGAAGHCHVGQ